MNQAETAGLSADFVVLDAEPDAFVFGVWRNVLIACWKRQANGPAVERLGRATEIMAERYPGPRSNVHLIAQGAALPTSDARAGFVRLMKRNAGSLACIAIVIEGEGFWASALRSAMTGLHLLAPRSFDFRLLGSHDEVAAWLPAAHERKTGVSLDEEQLRVTLERAVSTAP